MSDLFVPAPPVVSLETVREFLHRRLRSELLGNIFIALFAFCGAALVFFTIVWASYIGTFATAKESYRWLWYSLSVIAFSFIAHARLDEEYLSRLEISTVDGRPGYNIYLPGGWRLSNVNYLDPKTQRAQARIILQLLASGPRALFAAFRAIARAIGVSRVDPAAITGMFKTLVERGRRIPYDELAGLAARNPEKCFADLLLLDVAQHLKTEPQGMVIHSHIREKITGINSSGTDF